MILRIGIIGMGKIGKVHLANLHSIPDIEVIAISDLHRDPAESLASTSRFHEDWRDVVKADDIDSVIITLPHLLHAETAEMALRHGKHVLLEKPLATTLVDAQRLVEVAARQQRVLMVNMTHRFYPPVRKARELLQAGTIGQVISVRDYYMEIIDRNEFPAWFFDPVAAGGGVVITDSIHLLDRVAWVLGEPLRMIGQSGRRMAPDTTVEDCVEILCETASGAPVTVGSFFFSGTKTWADGLTIFGTRGFMTVQAWSHLECTIYGEKTKRFDGYDSSLPMGERAAVGHMKALQEFFLAIRENRRPEGDARTTLNAQEIVQQFYDSVSPGAFANACFPA